MIGRAVNDSECLNQLLDRARELRNSATARNLADGMRSPVDMARLLRGLPQRNDDGTGTEEGIHCDTLQRLRNWPDDPNCFERTAMFVAVADRLAPDEKWSAVTVENRNGGRHTQPVLLGGGRPIAIDVNPRAIVRNGGGRAGVRNGLDMWGDIAPRNAVDPTVQDVAGVVHTGGSVVLGIFGAGKAAEELGGWERKEGLLREEPKEKPSSTTATNQQPAPSTTPTEDQQWPRDERRAATPAEVEPWGTW